MNQALPKESCISLADIEYSPGAAALCSNGRLMSILQIVILSVSSSTEPSCSPGDAISPAKPSAEVWPGERAVGGVSGPLTQFSGSCVAHAMLHMIKFKPRRGTVAGLLYKATRQLLICLENCKSRRVAPQPVLSSPVMPIHCELTCPCIRTRLISVLASLQLRASNTCTVTR